MRGLIRSIAVVCGAFACAAGATSVAWAADAVVSGDSGVRLLLESQSSYVMLSGDQLDNAEDEDNNFSTTAGVARLNIDLGNGLNLQGDVFGEIAWTEDSSDNAYASALGGGLHGYFRGDSGALGLFAAAANVDINNDDDSSGGGGTATAVGIEGLWFADQFTLGVQGGLVDSAKSDDEDLIRDAFFARGLARYYVGESTLIQGEVAYLIGEMDGDNDDVEVLSVGARLQHELDFFPGDINWPGKVYVAYRGDFAEQTDPTSSGDTGNIDSHTILFGTTFTFGHSLRDNERNGAAFDLPAFARWQGIAAGPLE